MKKPTVEDNDVETEILSGNSFQVGLAPAFVTSVMHLKIWVGAVAIDRLLSTQFHESFLYSDSSTICFFRVKFLNVFEGTNIIANVTPMVQACQSY